MKEVVVKMSEKKMTAPKQLIVFAQDGQYMEKAEFLAEKTGARVTQNREEAEASLALCVGREGVTLAGERQEVHCDFSSMIHRLRRDRLSGELLVRAAKIKNARGVLTVVDATAGLGEDSLLLAAAGFYVHMYERNPVIAALLGDALERAGQMPEFSQIIARMHLAGGNSIPALKDLGFVPDVVFLDPMFPGKEKTALAKKKFQLLHCLETPCTDGEELLAAAVSANPRKIVIKRPIRGEYLGGRKPDYSYSGKTVRYDCIAVRV